MTIYDQEKKFYVYQYLRKVTSSPYYIGKGHTRRAFEKHQKGISVPKDKSRIQFLSENMNEADAFQSEILLIYLYGRIDLQSGILHNKTNGGEGTAGTSTQTKQKIQATKLANGTLNSNTPENNALHSRRMQGIGNPFFNKKHSEQTKKVLSQIAKNRTKEHIAKLSINASNRKKIQCEYCSKNIGPSLYARWHGVNCILSPSAGKNRTEISVKECPNCLKTIHSNTFTKHFTSCVEIQ